MGIKMPLMMVMVAIMVAEASASSMECVMGLKACEAPLKNSTETPSSKCCVPLHDVVENQTECVCGLFNNPTIFMSANVTTEQVFNLTARCNISDASPSMCSNFSGPSPAPGTTSGDSGKNNGSTSTVVAWTGISLMLAVMATLVF